MLVVVGGTVNRMLIAKGCSIKGETFECFWGCFFLSAFARAAHDATVTSAVFAPDSNSLIENMERQRRDKDDERTPAGAGAAGEPLASPASTGGGSSGASSSSGSLKRQPAASKGYVLVSADFSGCIKVFVNRVKPKHSSLPVSALS